MPLSQKPTASRLWLFGGDSITQGARHTHGARSYVQLFEEELRYRQRRVTQLVRQRRGRRLDAGERGVGR